MLDPTIDPNRKYDGKTPLQWAVIFDREEMVRVLYGCPRVDRTAQDCSGSNLLNLAALYGSGDIMRILLDDPDVDPNKRAVCKCGCTPLHDAVDAGNLGSIRALADDPRVDRWRYDRSGRRPFQGCGSRSGRQRSNGVFQILKSLRRAERERERMGGGR